MGEGIDTNDNAVGGVGEIVAELVDLVDGIDYLIRGVGG